MNGSSFDVVEPPWKDQVPSPRLGGPADYGTFAVVKRINKIDQQVSLEGMRVLDLGCGNGSYTTELARRAKWICALDVLESNLRQFKHPIPKVLGSGESLPFAANSFDAVTMIEVLEHTLSDVDVLAECFRVLRPGGLLILFVPNKLYPFESHPCHYRSMSLGYNVPFVSWAPARLRKHLCYARIYTRRQLLRLAHTAGFANRYSGYVFPPVDNFPLPNKIKNAYRKYSDRLETSLLACFGVSLFVVLQKPS